MRAGVRVGVDVGEARVGLAASDPDGVLATPVATLERDHEGGRDLERIAREVLERDGVQVYVGLPLGLGGGEGVASARARDYADRLHRLLPDVAVHLLDERLTTVDAHRALHDSGVAGRKHRARVDQVAAVFILQAALDTERATGRPAGRPVSGRKPRARRPGRGNEVAQS